MELDFSYLFLKHGDGARYIFETACDKAFRKEFEHAFNVECNPGDDGIDIFVGDFSATIDVYQCKYFIERLGDSQRKQIGESFDTAINSSNYVLKRWFLCVPIGLTIEEHKWWSKWKNKNEKKHNIEIGLYDSRILLDLIQKHKIDEDVFDLEQLKLLRQIHEYLVNKNESLKEVLSPPIDVDYSESVFIAKLQSANVVDHIKLFEKQFFNAEILDKQIYSKGVQKEIIELESLKANIHDLWLTQFSKYNNTNDGNSLVGEVFERIEDQNDTNLKTEIPVSVIEKKGILHQYAEECELGWVKNYKARLVEYLKQKENGRK